MANLVTVTKDSRLILKIGGIGAGAILLIYIFVQGGVLFRNIFFPKPPPVPKEALGKLPHIHFPSTGTTGIQFTVNTVDGQLPQLPDRIFVYKLTQPSPNLLALETAKDTVDSANFVDNQTKISDTVYQWTQAATGVVITYDIVSKNFTISSNFLVNQSLASTRLMPSEDNIKSDIVGFLQTIQANSQSLDLDKTKIEYEEEQNGVLVPAQNLGTAKFARITLVQKDVDNIPIIYDTPSDSILTFIVSYPNSSLQVLEGQYYNHEPDINQKSDYPIKTASQALEDLKNGNAYMLNPQNLTNVDITNIELKYYLNRESKEFLMPVIVFTGINFTAYVEAIPSISLSD
jgi:hypothetical protein